MSAQRHQAGPQPLPGLLAIIADVAQRDPALAEKALIGLRRYQLAPRPPRPEADSRTKLASGALLHRYRARNGKSAHAALRVLIIPSPINPHFILDLQADNSVARALAESGLEVALLQWPHAARMKGMTLDDMVVHVLLPALRETGGPTRLVGYCLGGTMAIALSQMSRVESLTLVAAPWDFSAYSDATRAALDGLWADYCTISQTCAGPAAPHIGALETQHFVPIEFFQSIFWNIDRDALVRKYARIGVHNVPASRIARFAAMEDWSNQGEPLPFPAVRQLFSGFVAQNIAATGQWRIAGKAVGTGAPDCPALHFVASEDRLVPPDSAHPAISTVVIKAGHVAMVAGAQAAREFHKPLARWLMNEF